MLLTAGRQEGQTDGSVPQQPQCLRILDGSCRLTLVHRPPSCSSTVHPRSPSLHPAPCSRRSVHEIVIGDWVNCAGLEEVPGNVVDFKEALFDALQSNALAIFPV